MQVWRFISSEPNLVICSDYGTARFVDMAFETTNTDLANIVRACEEIVTEVGME